jgi:putative ABC transport system permease protein
VSGRARPPRAAERLLARALAARDASGSVPGDLHEEFLVVHERFGARRAACWYWFHSLRIAARFSAERPSGVGVRETAKGDSAMRLLVRDIRHSGRALLKRPALSATVVLTLALALGANAAIFALIDALVLRPYRFHDVDRVVLLAETGRGESDRQETVSPANFLDWRRHWQAVQHLSAIEWWDVNLVGRDEPERVLGYHVSAAFFEALGMKPALGRPFVADDEIRGRERRVVLSHGLWKRRFAADPAILGQPVLIDGTPHEVVGVAPQGFDFPNGAEIWAPLAFSAETASVRDRRWLTVIGRLPPGRRLEDAQAEAPVIAGRLEREHPKANKDRGVQVHTLAGGMLDIGLPPILSLWQASGVFVLLIACANIANLLIARGSERHREIAVRLAIGARRGRVVRELLVEHALMAALAVPPSLFLANAALEAIKSGMPARLARYVAGWQDIGIDGRLVLFTIGLAAVTVLIFGLLPAVQASSKDLVSALNEGGRGGAGGHGRHGLRRALVVGELALALPLLVAAGLSVLGTNRFLNGPQGYDPDGVLAMRVAIPEAKYPDAEARRQFTSRVVEGLSRIPGAGSAAATNILPAVGGNMGRIPEIDGQPPPDLANAPVVDYRAITPAYFETLRIPIVQGRRFSAADREGTQAVAIVSRSMAARYWGSESPIGRRVRLQGQEWLTVVGVAGDVIHDWFARRNYPTIYTAYAQRPTDFMTFVVRTSGDPSALAPGARAAVRAVDASQPVFDLMTMRELLRNRTIGLQYMAAVMAAYSGLALVLAVVGIYALMAFLVTQRTHEFGVRVALGATAQDLVRLGVGQAIRLSAIGVVLGIVLSLALGRLIEAGLLGVVSTDARVLAFFAAFLVVSTLAAGYIPARRAAKLDPVAAIRRE